LRRHRDRCEVVPLGIRQTEFVETPAVHARATKFREQYAGAGHARKLVLFVGRLRYYKGLQFLIKAAPDVDAEFLLVGTGTPEIEAELRELAARNGVAQRVHFLGDVNDADKVALYYGADIFCMPSHLRSEAFGLSQVEAMACGLPVVSCDVDSGVPFVNQNGVSGLTVRRADPAALAAGLNRLLQDEELRHHLAHGARARAQEEFTAEKMCERVKAVYRRVLGQ